MCLIALALDQHVRFPLVIAANRDEFFARPASPLAWWQASPDSAPLLGGRDLHAGGAWLALTMAGRIAMLTNVRALGRSVASAPSRGAIVPDWLATGASAEHYWRATASRGHNPFNLLAGDFAQQQWWWADDQASAPRSLDAGIYGLSNAALDTPWPKVRRLKLALGEALETASSIDLLQDSLFAALADRTQASDINLPDTGVGLTRERALSPAFIHTDDGQYGTRCSTLLIVERHAGTLVARVVERQFDAQGQAQAQSVVQLEGWPSSRGQLPPVRSAAVSEA